MKFNQIYRIRFLSAIFLLMAGVVIVRLYDIQILKHDAYTAEAERLYLVSFSGVYDRGSIYFETKDGGMISAATLKSGYTAAVNLRNLKDQEAAVSAVALVTDSDAKELNRRVASSSSRYIELVYRLDSDTAASLKATNIQGLELVKEKWRYYPGETLAAHVVGFVGYSGDKIVGRYGLERYYDDLLSRDSVKPIYKNFFADLFSGIKDVVGAEGFKADIITTVEPNVEIKLEQELRSIHEKWDSDGTGGIIMDPHTGEIVAMAYLPVFDPNTYNTERDQSVFVNPLVERVYEMGSILKPLTVAAGLDSGAITPETTYDDKGFIVLDGLRISNFDGRGRGVVPIQEILSQSLNTGAVFVQREMGKKVFAEYFKNFGLGEETGIDLPGEAYGLIENLDSPRDIESATASFGQGIAITPIAMIRALSVLANGGFMVSPHMVKAFRYDIGVKKNVRWEEKKSVIRLSTAEEVTRMLIKTYDEAVLGGAVKMERYSIAAKTGTAQIPDTSAGGYHKEGNLHSFFGYFPAYDPKFIIFIYTINPMGAKYSSETLTHPFVNTVKFLINYYNIAPDR